MLRLGEVVGSFPGLSPASHRLQHRSNVHVPFTFGGAAETWRGEAAETWRGGAAVTWRGQAAETWRGGAAVTWREQVAETWRGGAAPPLQVSEAFIAPGYETTCSRAEVWKRTDSRGYKL